MGPLKTLNLSNLSPAEGLEWLLRDQGRVSHLGGKDRCCISPLIGFPGCAEILVSTPCKSESIPVALSLLPFGSATVYWPSTLLDVSGQLRFVVRRSTPPPPMATVEFKPEEALVLIDFLLRFRDNGVLAVEHRAEEYTLYDLCATLESQVPELLAPDYTKQLESARSLVGSDGWE